MASYEEILEAIMKPHRKEPPWWLQIRQPNPTNTNDGTRATEDKE